jgi:hypothetical protein
MKNATGSGHKLRELWRRLFGRIRRLRMRGGIRFRSALIACCAASGSRPSTSQMVLNENGEQALRAANSARKAQLEAVEKGASS